MFLGIGIGINRQRFGGDYIKSLVKAYVKRVTDAGGVVEAQSCVDAVSGLLLNASFLLVPSGFKEGKVYSENPVNGNGDLTWTRASDAWRTNASGLIQRVPWNLVTYSDAFDNAVWLKSFASITANATTAPDGTNSADKIIGLGNNPLIYQSTSTLTGKYTFSIYGKKGELSWLRLTNSSAGTNAVWFDLNNGAVGTIVGAGNSANITSVGNGWYRCEFIINSFDSSQTTDLVIACTNADNTTTGYTGNSVDGLFIWGAQLVQGSSAQTYFPTTGRLNVPRLDYSQGSCPAVLLEPQRTNLAFPSEDFSTTWGTSNTTVTSNQTTAPDGNNTADRISITSNNGYIRRLSLTVLNSTTYTISSFVKNDTITTGNTFGFYFNNNLSSTGAEARALIDINAGTATARSTGAGVSNVSASITSLTNGWYRVQVSFTLGATAGNTNAEIGFTAATATRTFYAWGAQLEAGAYPTTYIPTTSATATRVADSFSRSNIYTNGLISASGGTWFVELRGNVSLVRDAFTLIPFIIGDSSTSPNNGFLLRNSGGSVSRLEIRKLIAGSTTLLYTTTTDTTKIAIKWNGSTADVFVNGVKEVTATTFAITNMDFLIGNGNDVPKFIQQMALWPTPLSDAQLIQETTL